MIALAVDILSICLGLLVVAILFLAIEGPLM